MTKDEALNLDFSGGQKSWFDFWHIHVDRDGRGNKDWETREKYLKQLIETYYQLKSKLKTYPNDFQLWIMIDEHESKSDCVYIHTRNPNADNFPTKATSDNKNSIRDKNLKKFIDSLDFERVRIKTIDGDIYYLFRKDVGTSLV
ncbi:MAG: hypothetical protein ACK5DD_07270 [Cyclobacteriaceae bacterium]|jgi:hypothetical protein